MHLDTNSQRTSLSRITTRGLTDDDRTSICAEIYTRLSRGIDLRDDAGLATLVRPSDTEEPFQRWFSYREGYTVELCKRVFSKEESFVVDPFCGFGSTLVAARSQGIPSIGIDVNPLAAFVSGVKTRTYSRRTITALKQQLGKLKSLRSSAAIAETPNLRIIGKLFHPEILCALLIFRRHIDSVTDDGVRSFLILGWLAILEQVSNVFREGNGIKYRNRIRRGNVYSVMPYEVWQASRFPKNKFAYVRNELLRQLEIMMQDVRLNLHGLEPQVIQSDAGGLISLVPRSGASLALFSPPYCNCFNYIKAYKVELWMAGFIRKYPDIKALTAMGIRSRVESLLDPVREPYPRVIDNLIAVMDRDNLWSPQLPDVVRGYFADMRRCLEQIRRGLKRQGRCVIVVGNSAYAGVLIPTDLLLTQIARSIGFEVEQLVITRHLTTSSQQRKRLSPLKHFLRESVIHLRKIK